MGAINVGAVLTTWTDLPHRARVVLVAMAHVALDAPREGASARRYFGGPGYLAEVLYGPAGIEQYDDGRAIPTTSAGKQVEKVLTELVKAGAVRRVRAGGRRHRSEYEIVLSPPVSPTETVGLSPTETVGTAPPNRWVQPHRNGGPQENRGTTEEHQEENITSGDHVQSRATTPSDEGRGWSDVLLVDAADAAALEAYPAAMTYLERTLGTASAAELVESHSAEHGTSYTRALVEVAAARGWAP